MGLDLTVASNAMKEFYLPTVRAQFTRKTPYLSQVEPTSEDVEGLEAVLSLHVNGNQGVGARGELEDLPEAGAQGYAKSRVKLRYNYGKFQVSGPVVRAMKSDDGSWLRAVESETKGIVNDLRYDYERQLLGTSDGVVAATAANATATNTIVLTATKAQQRWIKKNMRIDIGTEASPASVAGNRKITAVNKSANTITIDGAAITTTTANRIFRHGSGGTGTSQREVTGIQTIVDDDGTLFGVDPTVEEEWKATVVDAAAAGISDALLEQLVDDTIANSTGEPDWAFTSQAQVRAYAATLTNSKRHVNTVELKGGFSGVEFGTGSARLALSAILGAHDTSVFALDTEHLNLNRSSDWEFMEEDGSVLHRIVSGNGKDGYDGVLFNYSEQTTDERNAHGRLVNLAAA